MGDYIPGFTCEKEECSEEFRNLKGGAAVFVREGQTTLGGVRIFQNTGQDKFNEHILPVNVRSEGFALLISADDYVEVSVDGLRKFFAPLKGGSPDQACQGWILGQRSFGSAHRQTVLNGSIGPPDLGERTGTTATFFGT